jgi:uncharacterized protein YigA (DUF484 family)
MSQQKQEWVATEEFSEQNVVDFLDAEPEFFERHPQALIKLELTHASGSAVSLVERQVAVLRDRNTELETRLKDLITVAKNNDDLVRKMHELALTLIATQHTAECIRELETGLRSQFSADRAVLVLFQQPMVEQEELARFQFLHILERDDPSLAPFSTFLNTGRARCGQMRDSQREVLFGDDEKDIGSVAMVPLGDGASQGFLVIANADPDHFHPGKSIDFLERIGQLVSVALSRA